MNKESISIKVIFKSHWFWLAACSVFAVDSLAIVLDNWEAPRLLEAGLLFDLAILLPLLYLWCYRKRGIAAVLKAVGLACLGVWCVGHIVPESNHDLLNVIGPLRYIGFAVLIVIEIKVVAAIYKAAFKSDSSAKEQAAVAAQTADMPKWVAKLMVWEASVWRRLWDFLKRLFAEK